MLYHTCLSLYEFYFIPDVREKYLDRDFAFILTLYNSDAIIAYSLISYNNNFDSDSDTVSWDP